MALLANDAKIFAQKFFANADPESTQLTAYRKEHKAIVVVSGMEDVQKIISSMPQLESRKEYGFYHLALYELYGAIFAAEKMKSYIGLCGEYTRAAACYLMESTRRAGINVSIVHLVITQRDGKNHAFVVLGRAPGSDLYDLNSWGNALICDADTRSTYNVYTCKNLGVGTPLDAISERKVQITI